MALSSGMVREAGVSSVMSLDSGTNQTYPVEVSQNDTRYFKDILQQNELVDLIWTCGQSWLFLFTNHNYLNFLLIN